MTGQRTAWESLAEWSITHQVPPGPPGRMAGAIRELTQSTTSDQENIMRHEFLTAIIPLAGAVAAAERIGHDAGEAMASWAFDGSTTDATYASVLAGLDAGDPATYDLFREPSFSGEYACDLTERALCEEVGVDYDLATTGEADAIADSYLAAAQESFWHAIERTARQHTAPASDAS